MMQVENSESVANLISSFLENLNSFEDSKLLKKIATAPKVETFKLQRKSKVYGTARIRYINQIRLIASFKG
jgi:AraC-like DNA-binding protein